DAISFASFYYERRGTSGRRLYVMVHDFPFRISAAMADWLMRIGLLPASHKNAEAVLTAGHHLLVFPGGAKEAFRPFWRRRQFGLGPRSGFIRVALRRRAPIVPMVTVGAHETLAVLASGSWLAEQFPFIRRVFRSDVAPLWIGLPFGVGFGLLPAFPL